MLRFSLVTLAITLSTLPALAVPDCQAFFDGYQTFQQAEASVPDLLPAPFQFADLPTDSAGTPDQVNFTLKNLDGFARCNKSGLLSVVQVCANAAYAAEDEHQNARFSYVAAALLASIAGNDDAEAQLQKLFEGATERLQEALTRGDELPRGEYEKPLTDGLTASLSVSRFVKDAGPGGVCLALFSDVEPNSF